MGWKDLYSKEGVKKRRRVKEWRKWGGKNDKEIQRERRYKTEERKKHEKRS